MSWPRNSVIAVTVTYSERWEYLSKVILRLLEEKDALSAIVIVDNGTKYGLQDLVHELGDSRIIVVRSEENLGSAGGFSLALERSLKCQGEYIWMLDDDNLPGVKSLQKLYFANELVNANNNNCLVCYRPNRVEYKEVLATGLGRPIRKNSFFGFHILGQVVFFKKIIERLFSKQLVENVITYPISKLYRAPYGGMLIPKSVLASVGFPNKDYVLYMDDHDFSERIRSGGGNIYLVANSEIGELEPSWDRSGARGHYFFKGQGNDSRLYYAIRNRVHLDRITRVDNKIIYITNAVFYVFFAIASHLVSSGSVLRIINRLPLLKNAIGDGLSGRLGVNQLYKI